MPPRRPPPPPPEPPSRRRALLFAGAAVASLALTGYWIFADGDEEKIRKVLARLARSVSMTEPPQNPAIDTLRMRKEFTEIFTADATVSAPEGRARGPGELASLAGALRSVFRSADVTFGSVEITFGPDRKTAEVRSTATLVGDGPDGNRIDRRGVRLELVKSDGWRIAALHVGERGD